MYGSTTGYWDRSGLTTGLTRSRGRYLTSTAPVEGVRRETGLCPRDGDRVATEGKGPIDPTYPTPLL